MLGEKHGDPFAPHDGFAYVNCLIMSIEPRAGDMTLSGAEFRAWVRVHVARQRFEDEIGRSTGRARCQWSTET